MKTQLKSERDDFIVSHCATAISRAKRAVISPFKGMTQEVIVQLWAEGTSKVLQTSNTNLLDRS